MKLPKMTHLHYLVIRQSPTAVIGPILRLRLVRFGVLQSLPGFYQMMSRMVRDGLVKSWTIKGETRGQPMRMRCYIATRKGINATLQTRKFYS